MTAVIRDHAAPSSPSANCERCGLPKAWHAGPVNRAVYRLWRALARL